MGLKSTIVKPVAGRIVAKIKRQSLDATKFQYDIFRKIVAKASSTTFGKEHGFSELKKFSEFARQVPIRDYEGLKPWVDHVVRGEQDILWPGKPKYFAKTSGTTSGAKYIPITADSMPNHFNSARNALFCQAVRLKDFSFFNGKMIFLSGSPELDDTNGIPTGRLSGIVNHAIPAWLRRNQLPTYTTNCIEDWDKKIDAIIRETYNQPMTLISGIPPWVKDYYTRLLAFSGKETIKQIFPELRFMVHGGVNFEPYRQSFNELIGGEYHNVETYPASEGFIAYQDEGEDDGLLLNTNSGIFFEFVPADQIFNENPDRITLKDVETGKNYAVILSSNAGLWAYNLGDTIEFVSTKPFRIKVTGRIAHFISAFGEHVIAKEVEEAMMESAKLLDLKVSAFTVAPVINGVGSTRDDTKDSFHQWIIALDADSKDIDVLSKTIDNILRNKNSYYDDLRNSEMLKLPEIVIVAPGAFNDYMRNQGKLGGQNKVPVLSNDREVAKGVINA